MNYKLFDKMLIIHKKQIMRLGIALRGREQKDITTKEFKSLFASAQSSGKELALVNSGFKCEKTGKTDSLQYHHLIERKNKKLISFEKYTTQKNYWANIVILNQKHHDVNYCESTTISEEKIKKIKNKYSFENDALAVTGEEEKEE